MDCFDGQIGTHQRFISYIPIELKHLCCRVIYCFYNDQSIDSFLMCNILHTCSLVLDCEISVKVMQYYMNPAWKPNAGQASQIAQQLVAIGVCQPGWTNRCIRSSILNKIAELYKQEQVNNAAVVYCFSDLVKDEFFLAHKIRETFDELVSREYNQELNSRTSRELQETEYARKIMVRIGLIVPAPQGGNKRKRAV